MYGCMGVQAYGCMCMRAMSVCMFVCMGVWMYEYGCMVHGCIVHRCMDIWIWLYICMQSRVMAEAIFKYRKAAQYIKATLHIVRGRARKGKRKHPTVRKAGISAVVVVRVRVTDRVGIGQGWG